MAHRSLSEYRDALTPNGNLVIVGGSGAVIFKVIFFGRIVTRNSNKTMWINDWHSDKNEDMKFLFERFEDGTVRPVIDRTYPLEKVPEAYMYLEKKHVKGKLVITMEDEGINEYQS